MSSDGPRDRAALLRNGAVAGLGVACVLGMGLRGGLFAAAILCPMVGLGLRALQRRPLRARADPSLPLALDLCAAALRAGRPIPDALGSAAPAGDPDTCAQLTRVAGLLRLGADPARAWSVVDPDGPLGPVAVAALRSATSGIRSAGAFERLADQLRADAAAAATARAYRAGVLAMAPLGACFLPSFVCLGIVPVVIGVAGSVLGVLR